MAFGSVMMSTLGSGQNVSADSRLVKICGVASAACAELVLDVALRECGWDPRRLRVGMILWPGSRRSVDFRGSIARTIADLVRDAGATPVGVFVDEDAKTLGEVCELAHVDIAQLHGAKCRADAENISPRITRIHVVDVDNDGTPIEATPDVGPIDARRASEWTLYDAKGGGTGRPFDWRRFSDFTSHLTHDRWLLAGGLTAENVRQAIERVNPPGLDVAGGVAGEDRVTKDRQRLRRFLEAACW